MNDPADIVSFSKKLLTGGYFQKDELQADKVCHEPVNECDPLQATSCNEKSQVLIL